ncbi:DUF3987 domain-containing protein [Lipingzhangella sp. LS1_29]|uniref:DUF3987 domain-containing protein n=1 Tax=Lipingzhangella rawalii TaxID=2055835 RepID=A0ABU2H8D4_9ACTN|nr:DUF3987 domain-containing protein [Lipingzhangella rawalii]MDS1271559.1 DUF3987 domain-containing protein [Lipingzhangella rawalii]
MSLAAVPDPPEEPGAVPPHDLQAEQAVLGAMLLSATAISVAAEILQPSDFYWPQHEAIYSLVLRLHRDGKPTDPVAVNSELANTGQSTWTGGAPYLHTLTETVPSPASAGYYAKQVGETARRRALITTGTRIAKLGHTGGDVTEALQTARVELDTTTAGTGHGWPEPVSLDALPGPLPEFPLETLPTWVGQFAAAVADQTQTPPDLAGCLALAALSTAASGRIWADTGTWAEPVCLYTVVAMPPASRKSAVFAAMNEPIFAAEKHLVEQMKPRISEARVAKRVAEAEAEEQASAAEKERDPQSIALAAEAAETAAAMTVPNLPKLVADDITPETLARQLADQQGRLALLAPEGGFFGTLAGRYGGIPNLDTFLKSHAGEPIRVDRQGREPDFVPQSALTIGIALQPEVLREVFATPGGRGRGLLARILYAMPADTVGWRTARAAPIPPDVKQDYAHHLQTLLHSLWQLEQPTTLTFTQDAQERLATLLYEEIEPQLRPEERLGQIRDWGGKLVGAIVRIAALLHLADNLTTGWGKPITLDTLERAIQIGEYYTTHALAVFGAMGTDPVHATARRILDWLHQRQPERFTKRDAFCAIRSKEIAKANDVDTPLALLTDLGWIHPEPTPNRSKGGRPPSPTYRLHPHIHDSAS